MSSVSTKTTGDKTMIEAPWTQIGSLQQDVMSLKSELHRKVDSHEIHTLSRRLDSLEHTLGNLSSEFSSLLDRVQRLEGIQ